MKFPKEWSYTYKALRAIHANGSMTLEQVLESVPGLTRATFYTCASDYNLALEKDGYSLPDYLRRHFNGEEQLEAQKAEVVAPRRLNVFNRAMTGYDAAMRANRRESVRDISIKSCSSVSHGPWILPL